MTTSGDTILDSFDMEADLLADAAQDDEQDAVEDADDFSDLDDLLAEATAATAEEKRLKQARKRLASISRSTHESADSERAQLVAEIKRLEEGRVWLTVGAVALFYTQTCAMCAAKHRLFMGWMTEQKHASDPNARRLTAGKPVEQLPERTEFHDQGLVELCYDCVECVIAIDVATGQAER
jgi:hypothetical protein